MVAAASFAFFPVMPLGAQPGADSTAMAAPALEGGDDKPGQDLISLHFQEADIRSVLQILALKGNVNIVAAPGVEEQKVTIDLKDVTWEAALRAILSAHGLAFEREGNLYEIMPLVDLENRRRVNIESRVFNVEYAPLAQITQALKDILSEEANLQSIPGTNQIVVRDTLPRLNDVEKIIRGIDQRAPQVYIDAKVVRTILSEGENMGVDWSTIARFTGAKRPTTYPFSEEASARSVDRFFQRFDYLPRGQTASESTVSTTSGGGQNTATSSSFPATYGFPFAPKEAFVFGTFDFSQFSAVFNMIKNRKNTKVISNPRIVVLDHQAARVQVGGEVGIPLFERNETTGSFEVAGYEPRNFGIVLNVTPHVTKKGEILLEVKPEVTSFLGFVPIGQTNLATPQFDTIVAETKVLIQSGDTVVIGGLISDQEDDQRNRVPALSRIPLLGWLFKSLRRDPAQNRKAETIFFLTVTLADMGLNEQMLAQWKQNQGEYESFKRYSETNFLEGREENAEEKKKP